MTQERQLDLFLRRVQELSTLRFIKFTPRYSIKWTKGDQLRHELTNPDEEELRSFLVTFRQFISKSEPVFLNRIYNLLFQVLTSDELRGFLLKSREAWQRSLQTTGGKVMINDRHYTPELITDLLINGYYFHNDEEKEAELRELWPSAMMLVRSQFYFHLSSAISHLFYTANLLAYAKQHGHLDLTRIRP
jgi:hypothetical protein